MSIDLFKAVVKAIGGAAAFALLLTEVYVQSKKNS